jgi:hypothetical protein
VSESTLEAAAVPESPSPERASESRSSWIPAPIRRHPWWVVGVCLVLFSWALVHWARTSPGYDPYGWLIWGYQTLHASLDLGGAPSWKPLPFLFTVPYSLFGHEALRLWMVTAVAVALSGGIFAGRIAYRVTLGEGEHRYAAIAGGVVAGLGVLGIQDYMHYVLSAQSDPMIVAFCLGAIDLHLSKRYRWAFVFGVLASLGRPEAWLFLGLYTIWAWRSVPSMRWLIVGGLAVIPVMWFGVPTITNGRPFVSAQLALRSPRELHQNKIVGVFDRYTSLTYVAVQITALVAVALAWLRRNWTVLAIAAGAVGWVVVEIAFALHGWAAVPRYLFEAGALTCVLAGIAVGWLLQGVPELGARVPRWVGIAAAAIAVVVLVPGALARVRTERKDLTHERARTTQINQLETTISHLGGYRHVRRCGEPVTTVRYVSVLAYDTKLNVGLVGHRPTFELHQKYPIVMFEPLDNGWKTFPWHTAATAVAPCANVNASWVYTTHHPGGVLLSG